MKLSRKPDSFFYPPGFRVSAIPLFPSIQIFKFFWTFPGLIFNGTLASGGSTIIKKAALSSGAASLFSS
jgi:hypothetical protein